MAEPVLRRSFVENPNTQKRTCQFEVSVDLSKAPPGQIVDVANQPVPRTEQT